MSAKLINLSYNTALVTTQITDHRYIYTHARTHIHTNYIHACTHAVQVSPSGRTMSLVGSDTITGSCCTMLDILHNLVQVLDVPVGQAVAMLTENPARCVGIYMYLYIHVHDCFLAKSSEHVLIHHVM